MTRIKRRDFLKLIGAGAAGTVLPLPKAAGGRSISNGLDGAWLLNDTKGMAPPQIPLGLLGMPMTDPMMEFCATHVVVGWRIVWFPLETHPWGESRYYFRTNPVENSRTFVVIKNPDLWLD